MFRDDLRDLAKSSNSHREDSFDFNNLLTKSIATTRTFFSKIFASSKFSRRRNFRVGKKKRNSRVGGRKGNVAQELRVFGAVLVLSYVL